MTSIGVISDTHGQLRPEAVEALKGSDMILHGGDVGKPEILDQLQAIAPVKAVRGNVDHGAWAAALPLTQDLTIGSAHVHMIHILNDLRIDPAAAGVAMVIYGHSHKPDIARRNGVVYFNPGSAGPRRFKLPVTLGRLTLRDGALVPEIIDLGV